MNSSPLAEFAGENTHLRYEEALFRLILLLVRTLPEQKSCYVMPLDKKMEGAVRQIKVGPLSPTLLAPILTTAPFQGAVDSALDIDQLGELIRALCLDIFTKQWEKTPENLIPDPTMRTVMMSAITAGGTWDETAEYVPPIIAKLKWCIVSRVFCYPGPETDRQP